MDITKFLFLTKKLLKKSEKTYDKAVMIKKGLENNTIPTFDDLDTREDFQAFFKKDGYQYSYTIVEAIVNIFGYDKLRNLVKTPDKIVDVFGITKNELQNKWIEYIRNNYL
jgi:hypothetical protein